MATHTSRSDINETIKSIKENEDYSESMRKGLIELVMAEAAEKKAAEEKAAKEKAAKEKAAEEAVVSKIYSEKEKFHIIKDYLKSLLNHPELEEKEKNEILELIILMKKLDIEIKKIDSSQTDKDNAYYFANTALLKIGTVEVNDTSKNISGIFDAVQQEALKQEALKHELAAVEKETERKRPATFYEKGESFHTRPNLTSEENHTAKTKTANTEALDKIALQLGNYNITLKDEQNKKTNSCSFFNFDMVKFAFGIHHTQKEAASEQLRIWITALRKGENGPSLSSYDQKALKDGRLGAIAENLATLYPAFKAALDAKPTAQTAPAKK